MNSSGVNSTRLAEAHASRLEGSNYTTHSNWTLEGAVGVEVPARADVVREVSASRDQIRAHVENGNETSDQYVENGTLYEKRMDDSGTSYLSSRYEPLGGARSFASARTVRTYLFVADYVPTGTVERDGRTLVVLEADGEPNSRAFVEDPSEFRARALVDEQGVVREFTLYVSGESYGHELTLELALAVESVGNTTVDTPTWLGEAKAAE